MNKDEALGLVRHLIAIGQTKEQALNNTAIPSEFIETIKEELEREDNIILEPAHFISENTETQDWLQQKDRSKWYYWPTLRIYLLSKMSLQAVRLLDEITDRILGYFAPPEQEQFDVRGLVLGYVQSGKTTNFTATIAKAADSGYRLIIVLSGIDKGLRRQTQIRLEKELIGSPDNNADSVRMPPVGRQWHKWTTVDIDGDFRSGTGNPASLQGDQPVIMVIKKNSAVLRRLLTWLDGAPDEIKRLIPTLIIDDEADLASIDTKGTYYPNGQQEADDSDEPNEPSKINGLIRELLNDFQKKVYVAYTATPFANILIPHDTIDPQKKNDLYPKDFIVDLPKPDGYLGTEELFGIVNPISGEEAEGLDIIREVEENAVDILENGQVPKSLENAILSFVLAGAAFAQRGRGKEPATMLIHTEYHIQSHEGMKKIVEQKFKEFKDSWRYQKELGIKNRLEGLWNSEFRPVTQSIHPELDVNFEKIEPFINPFFEAIQIRTVNSSTGEILDYEREPRLKAIAIGGNKFSRGLTLEGLMTSFFTRNTSTYDTLMQMGRWFGFRRGYEDLTRIWTTAELAEWFADLAFVERNLRDDIQVYEAMNITPMQVGMRIWLHPTMQVTSPLKSRFARETRISQSYNGQVTQTYKFPFERPETLSNQADANYSVTTSFLADIGKPEWDSKGPIWRSVPEKKIIEFLKKFQHDDSYNRSGFSLPLICSYIENQFAVNELTKWTIAVRGQENEDEGLGEAKWGVEGGKIWQISRTRLKLTKSSLGVITSPGDEKAGLYGEAELKKFEEVKQQQPDLGESVAARMARPPQEGLILIYPISKNSKPVLKKDGTESRTRQPLYEETDSQYAKDLIGLAISFPESQQDQPVQAYLEGTNRWRPVE